MTCETTLYARVLQSRPHTDWLPEWARWTKEQWAWHALYLTILSGRVDSVMERLRGGELTIEDALHDLRLPILGPDLDGAQSQP